MTLRGNNNNNNKNASSDPQESDLRLMICTANIGNAEPTVSSIASMLPEDGEIVNDAQYKLPLSYSRRHAGNIDNHAGEFYDIIVIGMQESTFKLKKQQPQQSEETASTSETTTNNSENDLKNLHSFHLNDLISSLDDMQSIIDTRHTRPNKPNAVTTNASFDLTPTTLVHSTTDSLLDLKSRYASITNKEKQHRRSVDLAKKIDKGSNLNSTDLIQARRRQFMKRRANINASTRNVQGGLAADEESTEGSCDQSWGDGEGAAMEVFRPARQRPSIDNSTASSIPEDDLYNDNNTNVSNGNGTTSDLMQYRRRHLMKRRVTINESTRNFNYNNNNNNYNTSVDPPENGNKLTPFPVDSSIPSSITTSISPPSYNNNTTTTSSSELIRKRQRQLMLNTSRTTTNNNHRQRRVTMDMVKPLRSFEPPVFPRRSWDAGTPANLPTEHATLEMLQSKPPIISEKNSNQKGKRLSMMIPTTIRKTRKRTSSTIASLTATQDHTVKGVDGYGKDTKVLHKLIQERCPSYRFVVEFLRGEMRLVVLVRGDLEGEVGGVEVVGVNTGYGGLANKGGICATLTILKTRLAFISAHLEAHEGKKQYFTRCNNITAILSGTKAQSSQKNSLYDASLTSHHCFVLGDLNYRLVLPDEVGTEEVVGMVEQEKWDLLNAADELEYALKRGHCLAGFRTVPCYFPPTFKVMRQKGVKYSEQRTPSYTDRILWKSSQGLCKNVKPLLYEPCLDFSTSDHKPIRGAFALTPNAPRNWWDMDNIENNDDTALLSFHIIISGVTCTNLKAKDVTGSSDPYVMFVTEPASLLDRSSSNNSKTNSDALPPSILNNLNNINNNDNIDDLENNNNNYTTIIDKRTAEGWPRTKKLKKTLNPDWKSQQISLTLTASHPEELVGGILYLTVMDHDLLSRDDVIGAAPMNIRHLFDEVLKEEKYNDYDKEKQQRVRKISVEKDLMKNGLLGGVLKCDITVFVLQESR